MAGWICKDGVNIRWDGTLNANSFEGDGSKLSGITGGGGGGTLWASAAQVIYPKSTNQTISGANLYSSGIVSGAYLVSSGDVSGVYIWGDGSNLTGLPGGTETDPIWVAASSAIHTNIATVSGALNTTSGALKIDIANRYSESSGALIYTNYQITSGAYIATSGVLETHIGSGSIHYASGAIYAYVDAQAGGYSETSGALLYTTYQITSGAQLQKYNQTSGATHVASGSIHYASSAIYTAINAKYNETSGARTYTSYQVTSGAYISHAADSTSPHGTLLTQTNLALTATVSGTNAWFTGAVKEEISVASYARFTSGAILGDGDSLSGARIQNIVIGTGAVPPTASNFPRGTIYVQYTP